MRLGGFMLITAVLLAIVAISAMAIETLQVRYTA
jgi:hypothetical protein